MTTQILNPMKHPPLTRSFRFVPARNLPAKEGSALLYTIIVSFVVLTVCAAYLQYLANSTANRNRDTIKQLTQVYQQNQVINIKGAIQQAFKNPNGSPTISLPNDISNLWSANTFNVPSFDIIDADSGTAINNLTPFSNVTPLLKFPTAAPFNTFGTSGSSAAFTFLPQPPFWATYNNTINSTSGDPLVNSIAYELPFDVITQSSIPDGLQNQNYQAENADTRITLRELPITSFTIFKTGSSADPNAGFEELQSGTNIGRVYSQGDMHINGSLNAQYPVLSTGSVLFGAQGNLGVTNNGQISYQYTNGQRTAVYNSGDVSGIGSTNQQSLDIQSTAYGDQAAQSSALYDQSNSPVAISNPIPITQQTKPPWATASQHPTYELWNQTDSGSGIIVGVDRIQTTYNALTGVQTDTADIWAGTYNARSGSGAATPALTYPLLENQQISDPNNTNGDTPPSPAFAMYNGWLRESEYGTRFILVDWGQLRQQMIAQGFVNNSSYTIYIGYRNSFNQNLATVSPITNPLTGKVTPGTPQIAILLTNLNAVPIDRNFSVVTNLPIYISGNLNNNVAPWKISVITSAFVAGTTAYGPAATPTP